MQNDKITYLIAKCNGDASILVDFGCQITSYRVHFIDLLVYFGSQISSVSVSAYFFFLQWNQTRSQWSGHRQMESEWMGITEGPIRINSTYKISDGAKTALHGCQFPFDFLICNLQIIW